MDQQLKNKLYKDAIKLYGTDSQMMMIAEEAIELAHAIHKWYRAYNEYWDCPENADDTERQSISRALVKQLRAVVEESADVQIMIEQLHLMHPMNYQLIYEEKLARLRYLLKGHGVDI